MNKIILVHYINIGGLSRQTAETRIMSYMEHSLPKEDSIINYIVPIENSDSRIECLNPRLLSELDYQEIQKVIDKNNISLNNLLKTVVEKEVEEVEEVKEVEKELPFKSIFGIKTVRYRVINDSYGGYKCQQWRIYFPFWVHMDGYSVFKTLREARQFIHNYNKTVLTS